jgi:hypothetical protein
MLNAWVTAAPALAAAVGVLTLPGLAVGYAAGLRGIPAWGVAAPLSVTVASLGAIAAQALGIDWGLAALVGASAAATLLAAGMGRLAGPRAEGDPAPLRAAAAVAAAVGALFAAAAVVRGIGRPDRLAQTFDAVFHLNAVHRAVTSGEASSLTLGTLTHPELASAFYPGAWHALAAVAADVADSSVVVSASSLSVAMAMVWPLGCLLLVRQVLGRSLPGLVAGGGLAGAFGAAPFMLLSYGTVWPNALGTVLLPAVLGVAVAAVGQGSDESLGRRRSWLVGVATLPGLTLAHPNTVVAVVVYAVPLTAAVVTAATTADRRHTWRPALWTLWVMGCALVLWAMIGSPLFAATRGTNWPARESLAQATGEALLIAPKGMPVAFIVAAAAIGGLWVALRSPRLRWLAGCHLAMSALYALAAGSDGRLAQALTAPWYNDAFRLGALLPVTAVALVAVGAAWLAGRVPGLSGAAGPALRRPEARPYAVCALALAGVVGTTQGLYLADNARTVARFYGNAALVGPREDELLRRLPALVPAGSVIAGNPWNGSALAEAIGGRAVLFPHLNGAWGADRTVVASALSRASLDPSVCAAVRRLGVSYVLDGRSAFWVGDPRQKRYAGLRVAGATGFEPVASGGRFTLYRVDACA